MMRIIVPPIKSQGIKTKLVPWIRSLTPNFGGRWIEPFLGTGVVALNSGAQRAILGDTNPHTISFYAQLKAGVLTPGAVREFLENEGAKLRRAGNSGYDHYRLVRERFNKAKNILDFLFLSRAGFNGMMRFNRKGEWNIPFCQKPNRFNKSYITKIVNQVRTASTVIQPGWEFMNLPFEETIAMADAGDFLYCDPPYAGRYVDYYNGWSDDDERKLFEMLSATPARFVLSTWHHNTHRENEMIQKYWNNFNIVTRDHFYHSGAKIENRQTIVEALVFNFSAHVESHNHGLRQRLPEPTLFA